MQVTVNKLSKSRVSINVEIEDEKVNEAFVKAYKNISKKANISGFRKGKVPRKILERSVGKEIIIDEAQSILLSENYPEAIKKSDVFPLGEPDLEVIKIEEGYPMVFKAELDIKPSIDTPDYKNVKIEIDSNKYKVKDTNIEESINTLRTNLAETVEIKERGLQEGDIVELTIEITQVEDPEKTETFTKKVLFNSDNFDEELIEPMKGMKTGETKKIEIIENKDSKDEKKLLYSITVNLIKELSLPELTDEFISKNTRFKTLDELKEKIHKDWEKILSEQKKTFIKNSILDKLLEELEKNEELEIPDSLISGKINNLLNTHKMQLAQNNASIDDYLSQFSMEKEDYIEQLKEKSIRDIKLDFIFDAIGKAENIQIAQEEVSKSLNNLNIKIDKGKNLKNTARKDIEDYLRIHIKKQRVIDFLLSTVPVIEI